MRAGGALKTGLKGRTARRVGFAVVLLTLGAPVANAAGETRTLRLHNIHTHEDLTITYKRGGQFEITSLRTGVDVVADAEELTSISEALDELATFEERLARVVDLKFFCGFTFADIAGMLGVTERTVQRDWEKARIYLHQRLRTTLESR